MNSTRIKAKLSVLIPSQIRGLRHRRNMSQKQLAEAAGMFQSRIAQIEMPGSANLTIVSLSRIASALGMGIKVEFCTPEEMLQWENDYQPNNFYGRGPDSVSGKERG